MPRGIGTYGSKKGRPKGKKNSKLSKLKQKMAKIRTRRRK
tara:strand:+ start:1579 stop:1698 length:120 start_codon:yes stop_codon:yes gene_type:complete